MHDNSADATVQEDDSQTTVHPPTPPQPPSAPAPPRPHQPNPSKFPTSLSDLHLSDSSRTTDIYKTLRALHHKSLSPLPRLHSILTDSLFIRRLHTHCNSLPLIANERCGSWYIPPELKGGSAYFKSTDGHYGEWGFSLRRLNLGVLDILGGEGGLGVKGAVLVDSTRRGKGMSDGLRRTVPIWVGVLNEVLFGDGGNGRGKEGWLQTPAGDEGVGKSERSQIEARLDGWVADFLSLGLDVDDLRRRLKRPIRCVWAVNAEWDFSRPFEEVVEDLGGGEENILVLASASRRVRGAEMSEGGYIQGAADDSEGWSRGLTAELWWANRDRLLDATDEEVEDVIDEIVAAHKQYRMSTEGGFTRIEKTPNLFIGSGRRETAQEWDLVINCQGLGEGGEVKDVLNLTCRDGKLGSKDLRDKLALAKENAGAVLAKSSRSRILITCASGRDLSVGVALVLLCVLFNDAGICVSSRNNDTNGQGGKSLAAGEGQKICDIHEGVVTIDKLLIKKRLTWVTGSKSDANPSRATLQAVNSFLIDRPP